MLMLTLVLDTYEGRGVAIFDIPGAYLNADLPDKKYARLKGEFVDIVCNMNSYHIPNIRYKMEIQCFI